MPDPVSHELRETVADLLMDYDIGLRGVEADERAQSILDAVSPGLVEQMVARVDAVPVPRYSGTDYAHEVNAAVGQYRASLIEALRGGN